jgi:hypothetical protein
VHEGCILRAIQFALQNQAREISVACDDFVKNDADQRYPPTSIILEVSSDFSPAITSSLHDDDDAWHGGDDASCDASRDDAGSLPMQSCCWSQEPVRRMQERLQGRGPYRVTFS